MDASRSTKLKISFKHQSINNGLTLLPSSFKVIPYSMTHFKVEFEALEKTLKFCHGTLEKIFEISLNLLMTPDTRVYYVTSMNY